MADSRPTARLIGSRSPNPVGFWVASCLIHLAALWWLSGLSLPKGSGGIAGGQGFRVQGRLLTGGDDQGPGSADLEGAAGPNVAEFRLANADAGNADIDEAQDDDATSPDEKSAENTGDARGPGPGRPITTSDDVPSVVEPDEPRTPRRARRSGGSSNATRPSGLRGSRTGGSGGEGGGGTTFFAVPGRGSKFVYVIDRSVSMENRGRFSAAVTEMLASLDELPETSQVQVIFYNQDVIGLDGDEGKPVLVRNSPMHRRQIAQLAAGVQPDGGTRHLPALLRALKWAPDVIYLLTDADEPKLLQADLDQIRRGNLRRTSIHTIELGVGPLLESNNFLMRLARQNHGTYRYCDIEELTDAANDADAGS